MIKKNYKGRCDRKQLRKHEGVCRLYNKIQIVYAGLLEKNIDITRFQCNVPLENLDIGEYTTDFVCWKSDGTLRVRECVKRDQMTWPSVTKLLDASRNYWIRRGVDDWGIVIDKQKGGENIE